MCGWLSDARSRASRLKRATRSVSAVNNGGRSFSATSRPSLVSRARYTSPIPPAPSGATISYGPSFVPEVRAIRARNYSPKNVAFTLEFNCLRITLIAYSRRGWYDQMDSFRACRNKGNNHKKNLMLKQGEGEARWKPN